MSITYTTGLTAEEYNMLRVSVGWAAEHPDQAAAAMRNSELVITARDGNRAVGMARLITDGGASAFLEDVVVHPDYRRRGIARELVQRVVEYIDAGLKPEYRVKITILSAEGLESFYESFGFEKRPSEGHGYGMALWRAKQ